MKNKVDFERDSSITRINRISTFAQKKNKLVKESQNTALNSGALNNNE